MREGDEHFEGANSWLEHVGGHQTVHTISRMAGETI